MTKPLTQSQKDKAARLVVVQRLLSELRAEETELRNDLAARVFPNAVEGAGNKAPIENGHILQMTRKVNRSVNQAAAQEMMDGDNTRAIAEQIFKVKYDLKLAAYKALSDEDKLLAADAVTEKDGLPVIEVKKPKR